MNLPHSIVAFIQNNEQISPYPKYILKLFNARHSLLNRLYNYHQAAVYCQN